MCIVLVFPLISAEHPVTTVYSFHHGVTELGNLQVRQITEYIKDEVVIEKKYGEPMTPVDTNNMEGWDERSKEIVEAITDKKVLEDFRIEYQEQTGAGVEEIITYDRVIEEDGKIAVRKIMRVFDEGVEISKKFHRSWIMPGDDPSGNDVMSKAVAEKLHTSELIIEYKAKMVEIKGGVEGELTSGITGKATGDLGKFNFQVIKEFLGRIFLS